MNNLPYLPRALAGTLERSLERHPVVVLTGARQTGKTTLVQNLPSSPSRTFRTLDDLDVLEMARRSPDDLLAQGERLTLDEVQRVPELLLAVKRDVDRRRRKGRFLLTGSANLLLMEKVSESLAGRAVYLHLRPMTEGERRGEGTLPPWERLIAARKPRDLLALEDAPDGSSGDWRQAVLTGGMPPAVLASSPEERTDWFEGYTRTYLERDLRDLSNVSSLPDFRRLMGLAAQRVGQLLNQAELGRDAGLSQATAHRYLNLLDVSFQFLRLPAYAAPRSARLIKSPKLYGWDPGLTAHLAGIVDANELESSGMAGALLENLILAATLPSLEALHPRAEAFYWRTAGGAEVDLVIERGRRLLPIEVKASRRVRSDDVRHLEAFLDDYGDRAPFGVVLYGGTKAVIASRRVVALPVSSLL